MKKKNGIVHTVFFFHIAGLWHIPYNGIFMGMNEESKMATEIMIIRISVEFYNSLLGQMDPLNNNLFADFVSGLVLSQLRHWDHFYT